MTSLATIAAQNCNQFSHLVKVVPDRQGPVVPGLEARLPTYTHTHARTQTQTQTQTHARTSARAHTHT